MSSCLMGSGNRPCALARNISESGNPADVRFFILDRQPDDRPSPEARILYRVLRASRGRECTRDSTQFLRGKGNFSWARAWLGAFRGSKPEWKSGIAGNRQLATLRYWPGSRTTTHPAVREIPQQSDRNWHPPARGETGPLESLLSHHQLGLGFRQASLQARSLPGEASLGFAVPRERRWSDGALGFFCSRKSADLSRYCHAVSAVG